MAHYEIIYDHIKDIRLKQLYNQEFDVKQVNKKQLNFLTFGSGYDEVFYNRVIHDLFDVYPIYCKTHSVSDDQLINYEITEELKAAFYSLNRCYLSKRLYQVEYHELASNDQKFLDLEMTENPWDDYQVKLATNLIKEILDDYFMKMRLLMSGSFSLENEKFLKLVHNLYKRRNPEVVVTKKVLREVIYEVFDYVLEKRQAQQSYVFDIPKEIPELKSVNGIVKMIELKFIMYTIERGVFFNYNKLITFDQYTIEFILNYTFKKLDKHYK